MRLLLLFFIGLLLTLPSQAQERIRNVRIRAIDSAQLEIRYDLVNALPGDSVYFDIRSRLRGALLISPQFVRGDIGTRITAGSDRRIIWNAMANGYPLNEEVQAKVYVKTNTIPVNAATLEPTVVIRQSPATTPPSEPVSVTPSNPAEPAAVTQPSTNSGRRRKKQATVVLADPSQPKPTPPTTPPVQQQAIPPQQPPLVQPAEPNRLTGIDSVSSPRIRHAGPAWALLSVVAPGIGNIFVQTPKPKVGFRPLLTVACYGLAVYGLTERQKSNDQYAIYEEQKNMAAGEPYYKTANDHYHRYFLATRGAIIVAAADVILTFFKGVRNGREARQIQGVTFRPGVQAGQPTAVVRYSF
ncbi:hypothetical protein [Spirosoma luteum]|uniref:hypothetical protein n=1 Tax=Spirosoma luteum TaxID=431553 RepID=UPI000365C1E3|nr:hypothetical protein [Spirosoma luteum]